jgi:MYXO-CTERM domain-containing protein
MRALTWLCAFALVGLAAAPVRAGQCDWNYPVGVAPESPAPLAINHPVNGNNLPEYGAHLGADFWSGGGCTDFGQAVYAVADGEIVEIVDALGSYLDVVVIRHQVQGIGNVYSMYGHIAREGGLSEGQQVAARQKIGEIDDVLAYFSPCHLHFELLNEAAYQGGPFCNGCENAGFHVSPGYDQNKGVTMGNDVTGDPYIEVIDSVADNRWYYVSDFLEARVGGDCVECGNGMCEAGEDSNNCPADCGGSGDGDGDGDSGGWDTGGDGDGDGDGDSGGWDAGDGDGDGDGDSGGMGSEDGGPTSDGGPTTGGWGGDFGEDAEAGCACATKPNPTGGALGWLGLAGLLVWTRRRRAELSR